MKVSAISGDLEALFSKAETSPFDVVILIDTPYKVAQTVNEVRMEWSRVDGGFF